MELLSEVKIARPLNAVAVGTSTQNGATVDMLGWDGVVFVALFGAITDGTPALKAQQGLQSDGSDGADLAGSSTAVLTTDDNKAAALDIFRPIERYVRPVVVRGGATGAVLDGVVAVQYRGRKAPSVQDATIAASKSLASPAEGAA